MKWFGDLRVGVRLGIASGIIGAMLLTVMFMAFQGESRLNRATNEVRRAGLQLDQAGNLRDASYGLDAEQTSYSLNAFRGAKDALSPTGGREEFLAEVTALRNALDSASKTFTSPAGRADLKKLRTGLAEFLSLDNQIVADFKTGTPQGLERGVALAVGHAADVVDSMRATSADMSTLADQAATRANAVAKTARSFSIRLILLVGLFALALGAVLMMLINRSISRPLGRAVAVLDKVAAGDLTVRLDVTSRDEVGQVASALNNSLERTAETMRAIRESSVTLASSSEELSATSAQLGSSAEETSAQASAVSATAEQVSTNVSAVASSSEEMAASIREIASSTNEAAVVAAEAVMAAETTNSTVAKLGDSSAEIGEVIGRINEIQGTIATAVEQQTSTTNEVTRNVTEAASGANEIASNMAGVAQAAQDSSVGASTTRSAASGLAQLAEELTRLVGQFVVDDGHIGHPGYDHMGTDLMDEWHQGLGLDHPGGEVAA